MGRVVCFTKSGASAGPKDPSLASPRENCFTGGMLSFDTPAQGRFADPRSGGTLRGTLARLYEQARQHLRPVAAAYVHDDAEDVVQEVFLKALKSADAFRNEASPLTWLHRITVNASIDHYRRRKTRERTDGRRGSHPASAGFEQMLAIRMALRQLTAAHRQVFVMAEVIGYTHDEIAQKLDIPPGTSKWRLAEARKRLQRSLSDGTTRLRVASSATRDCAREPRKVSRR